MFNKNDVSKIRETVESWEATKVKKALEKFPERKETFKTHRRLKLKDFILQLISKNLIMKEIWEYLLSIHSLEAFKIPCTEVDSGQ